MIKKSLFKSVAIFTLFIQFILLTPLASADQMGETCIFTAYYSPKPGQDAYVTGSEHSDKVLNGQGTHGASGEAVFFGMAAAPQSIEFGSLVEVPGFATLNVQDRGGAIIEGQFEEEVGGQLTTKKYYRIDIWMGEGDEGLARALNFGKRTLECNIYSPGTQKEVYLDLSNIPNSLPAHKLAQLKSKTAFQLSDSSSSQTSSYQSFSFDYQTLQSSLVTLGYYQGEVNGAYDEATKKAVIDFQVDHSVIDGPNSYGAGYFGPKTQGVLFQALQNNESSADQNQLQENQNNQTVEENSYLNEQKRLEDRLKGLVPGLSEGDKGQNVKDLQAALWEMGYYRDFLSGEYDANTKEAVFEFQKDWRILSNENEAGAGLFGPQTYTAIQDAVQAKIDYLPNYPEEMRLFFPPKTILPPISSLSLPQQNLKSEFTYGLSFDVSISDKPTQDVQLATDQIDTLNSQLDLNDQGDQVLLLQRYLIDLGYLQQGLDTGYFGNQTRSALLQFQLENGIISTANDLGAGRLGPVTLEVLNENWGV